MNPQSFRAFSAAKGSSISQTEMQKYRKAPRLANEEAEATCMSAAAAATRQSTFTNGSSMDLMAVDDGRVMEPATHGEWQFITDSKGVCFNLSDRLLDYSSSQQRCCTLRAQLPVNFYSCSNKPLT